MYRNGIKLFAKTEKKIGKPNTVLERKMHHAYNEKR